MPNTGWDVNPAADETFTNMALGCATPEQQIEFFKMAISMRMAHTKAGPLGALVDSLTPEPEEVEAFRLRIVELAKTSTN